MEIRKDQRGISHLVPPEEIKTRPWAPASIPIPTAYALQRMERGEASPEDQTKVLKWIVEDLCGAYDLPFRPDDSESRETNFACGKMHVGQQIVRYLKVNLEIYQDKEKENGTRQSRTNK